MAELRVAHDLLLTLDSSQNERAMVAGADKEGAGGPDGQGKGIAWRRE